MKKINLIIILSLISFSVSGQIKNDTIHNKKRVFNYKSLIIPTALISYGCIGLNNDVLRLTNYVVRKKTKGYLNKEFINEKFTIDNFTQYTPFLYAYGLNALGTKGKNNFKDRTIILGTAYLIMGGTVTSMKKLTGIKRPDGSSNNSFPSGHTATAFMGAEFLHQEFKDISIWYGISGYLVASGTGFLRMYNDRHWFTDIITGAGIGILSTKIAYWIHPFIKEKIFKDKTKANGMVMPYYNAEGYGVGFSLTF